MAIEHWFCVQTNPQREAFVAERIGELQPYLPLFKDLKGRIKPLFPRYLFVPAMREWGAICNTVGVRALLKSNDAPARIKGRVITALKAKERGGLVQVPPPPRFTPGDRLTITRGSLRHRSVIHAGMIGKDRERVLIEMLGQNVSLIVPSTDLVPHYQIDTRNRLRNRRETFIGGRQQAHS